MQDSDAMMKAFIDLADHCPKFLRSQIENVVELMLKVQARLKWREGERERTYLFFVSQVMVTEGVDDSWKQLSLEMVVTIAENAPAMMRKHAKFLPRIGQPIISLASTTLATVFLQV